MGLFKEFFGQVFWHLARYASAQNGSQAPSVEFDHPQKEEGEIEEFLLRRQVLSQAESHLRIARKWWSIAFATLFMDLFLFTEPLSRIAADVKLPDFISAVTIILLSGVMALMCLFHGKVWFAIRCFDRISEQVRKFASQFSFVLPMLFATLVLLELVVRFRSNGWVALLFIIVVFGSSIPKWRAGLKRQVVQLEKLAREKQKLGGSNAQSLTLSKAPIVTVRFLSVLAAVVLVSSGAQAIDYLPILFSCVFLLLYLQPSKDHFLLCCNHCGTLTHPLGIVQGTCSGCATRKSSESCGTSNTLFSLSKLELKKLLSDLSAPSLRDSMMQIKKLTQEAQTPRVKLRASLGENSKRAKEFLSRKDDVPVAAESSLPKKAIIERKMWQLTSA